VKGPFGPLCFGAVLAILLGLVRAAGGVALLATGPGLDPAIRAAPSATAIVGSVLLLLGAALVVAGIGLLGRRPSAWPWTIAGLVAFVIDGAVNGWVLYGRPGDGGTLANAVAATLIATILFAGRGAVRRIDGK
jgi:hypothetical protein